MKNLCKVILLFLFLSFPLLLISSEDGEVTISGYVIDMSTGEVLAGAYVYISGTSTGVSTDPSGHYSLELKQGSYSISFRFLGYTTQERRVTLDRNMRIDIRLEREGIQLDGVTVVGSKQGMDLQKPEMGTTYLPMQTIRKIPAMLGEVDLIKAIQLLPGVQATSEGSSSYSVRGGSGDQNLVLLDDATVYNASHLMGFFSVFNNDAVSSAELYKGDIPVWAGGRLSSMLDVRMKEGDKSRFRGSGGIGLLSSRLTFEGPIQKERSSFIISGRRSYYDIFTALSSDDDIKNTTLYFYDLNGKVNFSLGGKDHFSVSFYQGRDKMKTSFADMGFGNRTLSGRWNHIFNQRVYSNFNIVYSQYDYKLGFKASETNEYRISYDMNEKGFKYNLGILATPNLKINTGVQWSFHTLHPGRTWGTGNNFDYTMNAKYSTEGAAYVQGEQKFGDNVVLRYGLRWSVFANRGIDTIYVYNDNYEETGINTYGKGHYFNWETGFEPRAGISWLLNERSSLKGSYSRSRQYFQVATNSTSGTPLDMWFSAGPNIEPQISDQWALGYNRFLSNKKVELSLEVYYKKMQNTIDFKDHPEIIFNKKMEGEIRFGKGYAYGAELMASLNFNKLSGWASYAYSRSERKIDGIADDKWFTSPFEKPHSINIVLNYTHTTKHSFGLNWVFLSGQPATFPVGRMKTGNVVVPIYSDRNTERYPDYHRMDISYNLKMRNWGKVKPELSFSLYNAYGRHNTWSIRFDPDEKNPNVMKAQNNYLFSIIPSATLNLEF